MINNDCHLSKNDTFDGSIGYGLRLKEIAQLQAEVARLKEFEVTTVTADKELDEVILGLDTIARLQQQNIRLQVLISDCYDYFNLRHPAPDAKLKQRLSDAIDGKAV